MATVNKETFETEVPLFYLFLDQVQDFFYLFFSFFGLNAGL